MKLYSIAVFAGLLLALVGATGAAAHPAVVPSTPGPT